MFVWPLKWPTTAKPDGNPLQNPPVNSWHFAVKFAVLLIPQSETQDLFLLLDVVSRHDFVMPNLMI